MPRQPKSLNLAKAQKAAGDAVRAYLTATVIPLPTTLTEEEYLAALNAITQMGVHLYAQGYHHGIEKLHHD